MGYGDHRRTEERLGRKEIALMVGVANEVHLAQAPDEYQ